MNEYIVVIHDGNGEMTLRLEAETAAAARDLAQALHDGEIVSLRFERALSFSCHQRGTPNRR